MKLGHGANLAVSLCSDIVDTNPALTQVHPSA